MIPKEGWKKAIGTYLGWRCPECKRFVKPPVAFALSKDGVTEGLCTFCKTAILFEKVHFIQGKPKEPVREEFDLNPKGLNTADVLEKYWDKLNWDKIFASDLPNPHRIIPVNFANKPSLLKALKQYAEVRDLLLSEVVIGFAAKGYLSFFRKAHELNCPACGLKMTFIYNEPEPSVWKCAKCLRFWREIPPK